MSDENDALGNNLDNGVGFEMAKSGRPGGPAQPQSAHLSPDQIETALQLINKRILELKSFAPANDDQLNAMHAKLNDTAARVYPLSTIEYERLSVAPLNSFTFSLYDDDNEFSRRIGPIRKRIQSALSVWENEAEILTERLADGAALGGPAGVLRAYEGLSLHSEIERASSSRFRSGHYADAVEAAVKALNGLVRLRSSLELDGSALMQKAFGGDAPALRFNNLSDQSDRDEQKGFMMLFSGAVAGLRNPRAHGFINDDPERALEFIAFVSLLSKLLDGATA